jgi:hypothetical protein
MDVQRLSVNSSRSFEDIIAAFEDAVGHPNLSDLQAVIGGMRSYADLEEVIQRSLGRSGFMEFARFDLGAIPRKERGQDEPKSVRFLIGNPLVMKEMLRHVPDAGSYAPVTVLIDERPPHVHLSYDRMAGFLAPYGSAEALKVARDLDSKIESLLRQAAG